MVTPQRVAIVGLGTLGTSCALLAGEDGRLKLAGIVRREQTRAGPRPAALRQVPAVSDIRDLGAVDAALVCVPPHETPRIARELVERRIPVVECAALHGREFEAHVEDLRVHAHRHRVPVIAGAGWNPGALDLVESVFEALVPKGETQIDDTAGVHLHHTPFEQSVAGVRRAMATEVRGAEGALQRYLYVEPERRADFAAIERAIRADPASLGVQTFVFPLDEGAAVREEARGVLLRRHGHVGGRPQFLLLEARIGEITLAARMMVAAALALPLLERRGYALSEVPIGLLLPARAVRQPGR